jgi:hypothetical protein
MNIFDVSRFERFANVNTVELLSMLTASGKFRGVKLSQLAHSEIGVGIIAPWNPLAGHASWSGQSKTTGNSPGGALGINSD